MIINKLNKLGINSEKYKHFENHSQIEKYSFVLINPSSEFFLRPGDIVYLLKPGSNQPQINIINMNKLSNDENINNKMPHLSVFSNDLYSIFEENNNPNELNNQTQTTSLIENATSKSCLNVRSAPTSYYSVEDDQWSDTETNKDADQSLDQSPTGFANNRAKLKPNFLLDNLSFKGLKKKLTQPNKNVNKKTPVTPQSSSTNTNDEINLNEKRF